MVSPQLVLFLFSSFETGVLPFWRFSHHLYVCFILFSCFFEQWLNSPVPHLVLISSHLTLSHGVLIVICRKVLFNVVPTSICVLRIYSCYGFKCHYGALYMLIFSVFRYLFCTPFHLIPKISTFIMNSNILFLTTSLHFLSSVEW